MKLLLPALAAAVVLTLAAPAVADAPTWTSTVPSLPADAQSTGLTVVSCWADTRCVTVGDAVGTHPAYALTESGAGVTSVPLPVPVDAATTTEATLNDITCTSRECVAVGSYQTYLGRDRVLIETRSAGGSWRAQSLPGPGIGLDQIACNEARCVATGNYFENIYSTGFVAERAGGTWQLAQLADDNTGINAKDPVCAPGPGPCHFEEYTGGSTSQLPPRLMSETDGLWSGVEFPVPADADELNPALIGALSCPFSTFCTGVGEYFDTDNKGHLISEQLVEGVLSYQLVAPNRVFTDSRVVAGAADCIGAARCLSVANRFTSGSGPGNALVFTRSREGWTVTAAPLPAGGRAATAVLTGADCAATFCQAVGSYSDTARRPLAERWNGAAPVPTAVPLPAGAPRGSLVDVSCAVAACAAVGSVAGVAGSTDDALLSDYR